MLWCAEIELQSLKKLELSQLCPHTLANIQGLLTKATDVHCVHPRCSAPSQGLGGHSDEPSSHNSCLPGDYSLDKDASYFKKDCRFMVAKSRVLWEFCSQICDIPISCAYRSRVSVYTVPVTWRLEAQSSHSHHCCCFVPVIMTLRQVALLLYSALIYSWMCWGYFWVVINSSEGGEFCDWMFSQVALFLQLVLVCQKMAHFIIDYITSESTNILRTLKIKSKFLHINRKWQSNRQYTSHFLLSLTHSNFLKTIYWGPKHTVY